ncbi:complexin-3-like [Pseudochaenichthys georgianus]|uniref:complexin-3-like n=1 Tax=Pseudochaenichthys georgianus TaxID=52239 RepID=UPI00146ED053|nr:complexin-3-like [Pseudochaenichthys georgianus]
MESLRSVKKSLKKPLSMMTSCVSGVKERRLCAKPRIRWSRGGRGRGLRRSRHLQKTKTKDPSIFKSYNEDLEKERQQREAMNAQKNAERATMRAQFRNKYQLSESRKDTNRLRSVGAKVSLPHELSKIIHPENRAKDDGFNLLSAFQGLSFGPAALTERRHSKMSTPTATTCIVM